MKYIVGYQAKDGFIDSIIENKENIKEVYFSWGDMPNGRASISTSEGVTAFEKQQKMYDDLKRISSAGILQ